MTEQSPNSGESREIEAAFDFETCKSFLLSGYKENMRSQELLRGQTDRSTLSDQVESALRYSAKYSSALTSLMLYSPGRAKTEPVLADLEKNMRGTYRRRGRLAFQGLRDAAASQAAAYKIFEAIGRKPEQPSIEEDVTLAIDLKLNDGSLIQVKGRKDIRQAGIFEVTPPHSPGLAFDQGTLIESYDGGIARQMAYFRRKIDKYHHEGEDTRLYMLALPLDKIDLVTGDPTEDLIDTVRYWFTMHDEQTPSVAY